jgi:hypothetical protein
MFSSLLITFFNHRRYAVARSQGDSGKAQLATAVPTSAKQAKCQFPEGLSRFELI